MNQLPLITCCIDSLLRTVVHSLRFILLWCLFPRFVSQHFCKFLWAGELARLQLSSSFPLALRDLKEAQVLRLSEQLDRERLYLTQLLGSIC